MAAEVPKEAAAKDSSPIPGSFPETPFETPGQEPKTFSVNPIPATEGLGNPVQLAPGEKVPHPSTLTSNTIHSTVKDDETLKKPAEEEQTFGVAPIPATEGLGNPVHLQPGETVPAVSELSSKEPKSEANGMFGVPPVTSTLIPESSLPMDGAAPKDADVNAGPTIQSAHPESTTAALAGAVPKEPRSDAAAVPEVVKESQEAAHVQPEASAVPAAVEEKKQLEEELKEVVPEAPATSESSAVGAAATTSSSTQPAAAVPEEVKESISAAHASPEAAANPEAVTEKAAVEKELLSETTKVTEVGEPAPTVTAALAETAPATSTSPKAEEALSDPEPLKSSSEPEVVKPKDAATVLAVQPNEHVPGDVSPFTKEPQEPSAASTSTPAAKEAAPETNSKPAADTTPKKPASESSSAANTPEKKKKNRMSSLFKKLKEKF